MLRGSSGNLVETIGRHFELAAVEQNAKPVVGEAPVFEIASFQSTTDGSFDE